MLFLKAVQFKKVQRASFFRKLACWIQWRQSFYTSSTLSSVLSLSRLRIKRFLVHTVLKIWLYETRVLSTAGRCVSKHEADSTISSQTARFRRLFLSWAAFSAAKLVHFKYITRFQQRFGALTKKSILVCWYQHVMEIQHHREAEHRIYYKLQHRIVFVSFCRMSIMAEDNRFVQNIILGVTQRHKQTILMTCYHHWLELLLILCFYQ